MTTIERALVLDKNDANHLFFDMLLQSVGIKEVVKVHVGLEALTVFEKQDIHLVITAWELDPMPASVFIQRLRASPKTRHIPITIYSKNLAPDSSVLLRELGVENFFPMPLNKEKIATAMRSLIDYEQNLSPIEVRLRSIEDMIAENRLDEAAALVCSEFADKGPLFVRAQTVLGELSMLKGKVGRAEIYLQAALAEKPDHVPAIYQLSRCFTAQGKHAEAIATLKQLSGVSPLNILTLSNLGAAYSNASRLKEAKEALNHACDIDPDAPVVKDERGKVALKEGDRETAMQLLGATQNPGEIARYLNSIGVVAVLGGNFEEGIATYNDALKILAEKTKVHIIEYNMALAYKKKGDLPAAFKLMAKSYLACPRFEKSFAGFVRVLQDMRAQKLPVDETTVAAVAKLRKESSGVKDIK